MTKAVFSVFRRASEVPLFRIEKAPKLARKQGAYSVVAPAGLILKRGHDLIRVLTVLEGAPASSALRCRANCHPGRALSDWRPPSHEKRRAAE